MKTIGIKLADGTFYPILEEGTPKKRMLDLTTAKDNQTKVQIDLYRSENGTMDDAEYVDTLEVTKLNPHPNGEPELHLSVGLDEENKLTAEVVDPETGKKSETEVTLVSRTEAERAGDADTAITEATLSDDLASTDKEETTYSSDELPKMGSDVLEDMPFSFDHTEPHVTSELSPAAMSASSGEEFKGELPDFSELDKEVPVEDSTLESVDFTNKAAIEEADDTLAVESTTESDLTTEEFSLPDLDDNTALSDFDTETSEVPDLNTEDTTLPDFGTDSSDLPDFDTDSSSLPDFDTTSIDDSTLASESVTDTSFDETSVDAMASEDVEPENYDLPDFDSLTTESDGSDTAALTTGLDFDDLDDPAFNTTSDSNDDDLFGTSSAGTVTGSAMDFSDLYDKETIAGEHASLYDEDEEKKKTRAPVIICIICAIICVIATILVLFIVPSKYNLIASRNTNGVSILDRFFSKSEKVVEAPAEEPKEETKYIEVVVEEPKSEPAPQAVEDKIVIAPEPEKVVPVPPPAPVEEKKPEVKKPADVKYHIRWGDTLWDISESYYKTPWKYPKIATYNKIKNPDLIIAGSDINIPAE